ncbi:MAG: DUF2461 domain-containing protein [Ruminiclostridium sp.]|nr:DUF2461 domain-containing protein [Ruminiclostridium sp.]
MFQGFSEATNEFLWGIRFNNEKPWFEAHKQEYIDHVQEPLRLLAHEVYERFTAKHSDMPLNLRISRIYRDARRLHGRGPYKSNLWFTLRMAGEDWAQMPAFWFGIHPSSYNYGMGVFDAKPAYMARFRKEMDERPEVFGKLAKAFDKQDRFVLGADSYKRPKGTPPAPLDQWYNRKGVDMGCYRQVDQLLYSRDLVEDILEGFEELMPYYHYFAALGRRGE